jgi:hypothetical protein
MPGWDGNGNFTRNYDWTDDRDSAIKVQASRFDTEHDNFATGIQACLAKNGENAATADLNLGTYRYTNAGQATARTDLLRADQLQDGDLNYAAAGGTADVITIALSPAITAYTEGPIYVFRPSADNATTTPTINFNSVGAKTIKKYDAQALLAGDIQENSPALVSYDATDDSFILLNPASVKDFITASSTDTLTNKTLTSPTINAGALSGTFSGDPTFSGAVTFSSTVNLDGNTSIRNAGNVPTNLRNTTATPGNGTWIANVNAQAENDAGTNTTFARILFVISDDTDTTEDGRIDGRAMVAGSEQTVFSAGSSPISVTNGTFNVNNLSVNGTATGISAITRGTVDTLNTETSVTFSSIASGANRITIMFDQVSEDSGDDLLVQIGDSGGLETTGYESTSADQSSGSTGTTGFIVRMSSSGNTFSGIMVLTRIDGNTWVEGHSVGRNSGNNGMAGGGRKELSAELDRLAILLDGSGTFDGGEVNIYVE